MTVDKFNSTKKAILVASAETCVCSAVDKLLGIK
jgi:hypothetical protein